MLTQTRAKTCEVCKEGFMPFSTTARICGKYRCVIGFADGLKKARVAEKKAEVASIKKRRKALMTLKDHHRLTQKAFNAMVRIRDHGKPCISCNTTSQAFAYQAGHYLTVGAHPELRYDEDNCHSQCVQCNLHGHGEAAAYRIELVRRIGLPEVERLEGPNEPKHYTADALEAMRIEFRARTRALMKERDDV